METKREWTPIKEYEDILFDYYNGIARITINRERYRNAFTPFYYIQQEFCAPDSTGLIAKMHCWYSTCYRL